MLVYASLLVLFAAVTVPALGSEDLAWYEAKIAATVSQTEASMQQVLNQFTTDAINASSQAELSSLQAAAHADIDAIYSSAINKLKSYLAVYPDELAAQVDLAKARLAQSEAAAHAEINTTASQIKPTLPPVTTTTTTMPPTTTTTTTKGVTTTTTKNVTTTTTPPRTTTTSSTTLPPTTTTTTVPPTTTTGADSSTTTTVAAAAPPPPPPGTDQRTPSSTIDSMPPSANFDRAAGRTLSFTEAMRTDSRMMTGTLVQGMSVVLPPAVATAVLSLPIVIEIVLGTLFDSVQSLVVPMLILVAATTIIIWRESRSRVAMPRTVR